MEHLDGLFYAPYDVKVRAAMASHQLEHPPQAVSHDTRSDDNARFGSRNFGLAACQLTDQIRGNRETGYPAKINNFGGSVFLQRIGFDTRNI